MSEARLVRIDSGVEVSGGVVAVGQLCGVACATL